MRFSCATPIKMKETSYLSFSPCLSQFAKRVYNENSSRWIDRFIDRWLFSVPDKAPSEASFRGTEYLTIDLSKGEPVLSTQESISLQFKTRQPNGLLFYSGKYFLYPPCGRWMTSFVDHNNFPLSDFILTLVAKLKKWNRVINRN